MVELPFVKHRRVGVVHALSADLLFASVRKATNFDVEEGVVIHLTRQVARESKQRNQRKMNSGIPSKTFGV